MTLSEANVKRTWWIDGEGNMVYRLSVSLGQGIDDIHAGHAVSRHAQEFRGSGPSGGEIAHRLESAVIGHIRAALFPKAKD
jgi:hypothetical protein